MQKKKKKKKKIENIFRFWDNCYKLSILRREYMLSPVNWLKNSSKILNIPQRNTA